MSADSSASVCISPRGTAKGMTAAAGNKYLERTQWLPTSTKLVAKLETAHIYRRSSCKKE